MSTDEAELYADLLYDDYEISCTNTVSSVSTNLHEQYEVKQLMLEAAFRTVHWFATGERYIAVSESRYTNRLYSWFLFVSDNLWDRYYEHT